MISILSILGGDPPIKSWPIEQQIGFPLLVFFLMYLAVAFFLSGASTKKTSSRSTEPAQQSTAALATRPREPKHYPYVTTVRPPALPEAER